MRYLHNCGNCKPLGQYNEYDLYICNQGLMDSPTLLARYSDVPDQYTTRPLYLSDASLSILNWHAVALGRAVELGYIDIALPERSASYHIEGIKVVAHV